MAVLIYGCKISIVFFWSDNLLLQAMLVIVVIILQCLFVPPVVLYSCRYIKIKSRIKIVEIAEKLKSTFLSTVLAPFRRQFVVLIGKFCNEIQLNLRKISKTS